MSHYRDSLAFHLRIGDRPPAAPQRPDAATLALRMRLLREEMDETLAALAGLEDEGLAPAAHELADLLYVTYGTFVALGVDADEVFAAVHEANLRKAGAPRRVDGKQLKPVDWLPADVAAVIERQLRDRSQGRAIEDLSLR